jgi:gamma-glutamylcyclotransferase (GGCT)/AIG2-like uncharacterized protein YtfP
MLDRLFVYGTLRDTLTDFGGATYEAAGQIDAELYDLGNYPGAVASPNARLRGALWRLTDPEATLEKLDHYEDADAADPATGLFVRETVSVDLDDGSAKEAWVYFYNRSTQGRPRIAEWRPD